MDDGRERVGFHHLRRQLEPKHESDETLPVPDRGSLREIYAADVEESPVVARGLASHVPAALVSRVSRAPFSAAAFDAASLTTTTLA